MISLCYTLDGLFLNADITVGAFGIDAGDLYRSMLCFRQTDDLVEYIRCLGAVLCRVTSTPIECEYLATSMHSYSWSGLPF